MDNPIPKKKQALVKNQKKGGSEPVELKIRLTVNESVWLRAAAQSPLKHELINDDFCWYLRYYVDAD